MTLSLEQFRRAIDWRKNKIQHIGKKLERLSYRNRGRSDLLEQLNYLQQSIPELEAEYERRASASATKLGSWHPTQPVKRRSSLNYRSPVKKAISYRLMSHPNATAIQICSWIDEEGAVELPSKWSKNGNRSFETAYKDATIRHRIESLISKVRRQMRVLG